MIVFEHITRSPEERAFRARIAARERALLAEAAAVRAARHVAAGGERRRAAVPTTTAPRTSPRATTTPAPIATTAFRPLRPGDVIVKPPSLTATIPTSTTTTQSPLTEGPASPRIEPVAAILDRRQTALTKMAAWYRGDPGARPSAAAPVASAPAAHATHPAAPLPVAEIFASRQRTIAAARPWAARKES